MTKQNKIKKRIEIGLKAHGGGPLENKREKGASCATGHGSGSGGPVRTSTDPVPQLT